MMFKLKQVLQCTYNIAGRGLVCVVEELYRDAKGREMALVRFVSDGRVEMYSLVYLQEHFKGVRL